MLLVLVNVFVFVTPRNCGGVFFFFFRILLSNNSRKNLQLKCLNMLAFII